MQQVGAVQVVGRDVVVGQVDGGRVEVVGGEAGVGGRQMGVDGQRRAPSVAVFEGSLLLLLLTKLLLLLLLMELLLLLLMELLLLERAGRSWLG